MSRKRVAILGSTGSIGKNAIKVLRNLQSDFEIVALTANSNFQLLAEQANEFNVKNLVFTAIVILSINYIKKLMPIRRFC